MKHRLQDASRQIIEIKDPPTDEPLQQRTHTKTLFPKNHPSLTLDRTLSPEIPNLHHRLPGPFTHHGTHIPAVNNLPYTLAPLTQLPHVPARFHLEKPSPSIISARHEEPRIALEGCHRRLVGIDSVQGAKGLQTKRDDAPVRPACCEYRWGELNLTDQCCVTL